MDVPNKNYVITKTYYQEFVPSTYGQRHASQNLENSLALPLVNIGAIRENSPDYIQGVTKRCDNFWDT